MNNDIPFFKTGAGIDERTDEQKAKDWNPEEAFAPTPVLWVTKSFQQIESEIKVESINQGGTSRCVSEYAGIALETAELKESGRKVVFSRRDIYCRRANRPYEGMSMPDLFKLMREGACLESQLPSTDLLEHVINRPYDVTVDMIQARNSFASEASFTWQKWTIDDVARTISEGTPVCLFWYFDNHSHNEWWRATPVILNKDLSVRSSESARHQAAAVNFCLIDGVKNLIILDSAGQGTGAGVKGNIRYITEEFFMVRCHGAGFAIDKKNLDYKPAPKEDLRYNFTRNLENGSRGPDVEALQKILVSEGCLKLKTPTQFYGGMTQAGVKKFQEKYALVILTPLGLRKGTGFFGSSTRAFVNSVWKLPTDRT